MRQTCSLRRSTFTHEIPEVERRRVIMVGDEAGAQAIASHIRAGYRPYLCKMATTLAYFDFEIMEFKEDPKVRGTL